MSSLPCSALLSWPQLFSSHLMPEAFTRRSFCTQKPFTHSKLLHTANFYTQQAFTQRIFYTQNLLHTEYFGTLQTLEHRSFFTQKPLLHTASFHTQKLLHTGSFYTEKLVHRVGEAFIHRKPLHTEAFTHSQLLLRGAFPQTTNSRKLLHGIFYTQQALNWKNLLTNHYRNLDAATPIRFTMSSPKKQ